MHKNTRHKSSPFFFSLAGILLFLNYHGTTEGTSELGFGVWGTYIGNLLVRCTIMKTIRQHSLQQQFGPGLAEESNQSMLEVDMAHMGVRLSIRLNFICRIHIGIMFHIVSKCSPIFQNDIVMNSYFICKLKPPISLNHPSNLKCLFCCKKMANRKIEARSRKMFYA